MPYKCYGKIYPYSDIIWQVPSQGCPTKEISSNMKRMENKKYKYILLTIMEKASCISCVGKMLNTLIYKYVTIW